jgi:hypothetical protein
MKQPVAYAERLDPNEKPDKEGKVGWMVEWASPGGQERGQVFRATWEALVKQFAQQGLPPSGLAGQTPHPGYRLERK